MNTYFEKEQKKELGKLIDELINTYDTKILDKLDSGITKSLYEISVDDGKEILVKRPVLTKLINNHLKNQQIFPDFIGGPNSLTLHWNQDLNKMIYIFGEVHSEIQDCDTRFSDASKIDWGPQKLLVEDFFYSLIQTSDVFIDLFLEIPSYKGVKYGDMKEYNMNDRIGKIFQRLKVCIEKETRHSPECEMARIHYFDARMINNDGSTNINQFYEDITNVFTKQKKQQKINPQEELDFLELFSIANKYTEIFQKLFDINSLDTDTNNYNYTREFWKREFTIDNSYTNKELGQLPQQIKDFILTFCLDKLIGEIKPLKNEVIESIKNIDTFIRNQKSFDKMIVKQAYETIQNYLLLANTYSADIYLLSRVFKQFNLTKKPLLGRDISDQPSHAHNIIIYGGETHAENYRDFFTKCGFSLVPPSIVPPNSEDHFCLDIRSFHRPFFSYGSISHLRKINLFLP